MREKNENDFLSIDFSISRDLHDFFDNKFVTEIRGDMFMILEENNGERSKIGHLSASLIDFARAFQTTDLNLYMDVFDHSKTLSDFGHYLLDPKTNTLRRCVSKFSGRETPGKILIFESIEIDPEFRGKKLGLRFVQKTIDTFTTERTDCVALQASPILKDGEKSSKEIAGAELKLGHYWGEMGFEPTNKNSVFILWHEINSDLREELRI